MKIKIARKKNDFNIKGDKKLFIKISEDMLREAGPHSPSINLNLELGGHEGGKYFEDKTIVNKVSKRSLQDLYEINYLN